MQKRLDLQEHTYLRLVAVLDELAHYKTRDMTFDDVSTISLISIRRIAGPIMGLEPGEARVYFDINSRKV
jgi:hypothetical protein